MRDTEQSTSSATTSSTDGCDDLLFVIEHPIVLRQVGFFPNLLASIEHNAIVCRQIQNSPQSLAQNRETPNN